MSQFNHQRRQFIKLASAITATVMASTSLQAFGGILTPDNKMDETEQAVFKKMLQISLPTEGSALVSPSTLPVIPTIEGALLAGMAPHIRKGLNQGIHYFNQSAKAAFGNTFANLPDDDARKFVDSWAGADAAPHRALSMGIKKLTVLAYWAIPNTWEPLGYDGPVTEKWSLAKRGNTPEPNV